MLHLNLRYPLWMKNSVIRHFIGFLEKIHRPPKHFEMIRLQVDHQFLRRIPFFKKEESIFILNAPAEIATLTSLLRPYGIGQGRNRLRQLQALLRMDLHSQGEKYHDASLSKGPAKSLISIIFLDLSFNNSELDEQKRTVKKQELIRLAAIFGGTSAY
jgi:hypothetical protein